MNKAGRTTKQRILQAFCQSPMTKALSKDCKANADKIIFKF